MHTYTFKTTYIHTYIHTYTFKTTYIHESSCGPCRPSNRSCSSWEVDGFECKKRYPIVVISTSEGHPSYVPETTFSKDRFFKELKRVQ